MPKTNREAFGVIESHLGSGRFRIRLPDGLMIEAQVLIKPGVPDSMGEIYTAETINAAAPQFIGRRVTALMLPKDG